MMLTLKIVLKPESTEGVDQKQVTAMKEASKEENDVEMRQKMELEKEILAKEGMDLRFFLLRLLNSIWIVFVAALAGAAICAGGYMLVKLINQTILEGKEIKTWRRKSRFEGKTYSVL